MSGKKPGVAVKLSGRPARTYAIGIRIAPDLAERLRLQCAFEYRRPAEIISLALLEYFPKHPITAQSDNGHGAQLSEDTKVSFR